VTSSHVKGHVDDDVIKEEKPRKSQHITFSEEDKEFIVEAPTTPIKSSEIRENARAMQKAGPARRRQPSFKEDSPPLYNLFALSVSNLTCKVRFMFCNEIYGARFLTISGLHKENSFAPIPNRNHVFLGKTMFLKKYLHFAPGTFQM